MSVHSDNKELVLRYFEEMENAAAGGLGSVMRRYLSRDYHLYAVHPFNERDGADETLAVFWQPLFASFASLQRRQDIFMAGSNEIDGSDWVASMGHFMGLFDETWLGIPPSRKLVFLPYAEFNCIRKGKICKTGFFVDILSVMHQVGIQPLPLQTGAGGINPGPRTHDGVLLSDQDPGESRKTLDLVNEMVRDLHSGPEGFPSPEAKLANTWRQDMLWFGPAGIGSTYTIPRYREQHQIPFRDGLKEIVFNGHLCRFAEGRYAGWFGWPNLTMTPRGGFLGLPSSERRVDMRVVDIYRRQDDKLAENWIFIDILHWLYQQDMDVLGRATAILGSGHRD